MAAVNGGYPSPPGTATILDVRYRRSSTRTNTTYQSMDGYGEEERWALGSLHRGLRTCPTGMRAANPDAGPADLIEMESYFMPRARGASQAFRPPIYPETRARENGTMAVTASVVAGARNRLDLQLNGLLEVTVAVS